MKEFTLFKAKAFAPENDTEYIDGRKQSNWIELLLTPKTSSRNLSLLATKPKKVMIEEESALYAVIIGETVPTKEGIDLDVTAFKDSVINGETFTMPTLCPKTLQPALYDVLATSTVYGKDAKGAKVVKYNKGDRMVTVSTLPVFCIVDENGVPVEGEDYPAKQCARMLADSNMYRIVVPEKADEEPAVDETLGK